MKVDLPTPLVLSTCLLTHYLALLTCMHMHLLAFTFPSILILHVHLAPLLGCLKLVC